MASHRRTVTALLSALVLVGLLVPAFAGDYYDVTLANRLVCRLRDPGGYGSVSERGSAVEKNVVEALSVEDVGHPRMWTTTEGGYPAIYIGGTFLVQVRPGDAAGTGSSTSGLARQWLAAFKQQFPRAQPVTKMGTDGGGKAAGTGGGGAAPPPKRQVVIPEEDKALVEEVGRLLGDTRVLEAADFEARGKAIAAETTALIWRVSAGATTCDDLLTLPGADNAVQSTLNGLRFAREASDQSFADQKDSIALTVVKRVRAALGPRS